MYQENVMVSLIFMKLQRCCAEVGCDMSYCLNLVSRSSHGCTHPKFCTARISQAPRSSSQLAGWVWRAHASGQGEMRRILHPTTAPHESLHDNCARIKRLHCSLKHLPNTNVRPPLLAIQEHHQHIFPATRCSPPHSLLASPSATTNVSCST